MNRTEARDFMMKIIFEMEAQNTFNTEDEEKVLAKAGSEQGKYCKDILESFVTNKDSIDEIIQNNSTGWKLKRMPKTDLATLRLAVTELLYVKDIPVAVSVNEAVDIAKMYGTEQSAGFINAVLAKVIKSENIENK
ncbi:MAG: transcription antitermination factor NusB [Eubacteriales bacterium]|nr:transcription antitermination factor NusB [Eubacteriales bacterium]